MGEFEKHILQKASAFQMDPDPGTFDKVMEALEKKKRKRFLWLWFLIPGILIAGSGIFYIQDSMKNHKNPMVINNKDQSISNSTKQTPLIQPTNSKISSNNVNPNKIRVEQKSTNLQPSSSERKQTNKVKTQEPLKSQQFNHINSNNDQKQPVESKTIHEPNIQMENHFVNNEKDSSHLGARSRMAEYPFLIHPSSAILFKPSCELKPMIKNDSTFKKIELKNNDKEFSRWSIGAYGQFGAMRS